MLAFLLFCHWATYAVPGVQALPAADLTGLSRGNWTGIAIKYQMGKATIDQVLTGQTVTVGVDPTVGSKKPLLITFDASGNPNGGHIYLSIMQIATQMGFTVKWLALPAQGTTADDAYIAACVQVTQ